MKLLRKNKNKGAALIIVLFTLVIVSVFMSLMYAVSRKQILSETKERQASLYSQYLRTTLDIVISPLIMGNIYNTDRDNININLDPFEPGNPNNRFKTLSNDPHNPYWIGRYNQNIIIQLNDSTGRDMNLYYRESSNGLWVLNRINISRNIGIVRDNNNNVVNVNNFLISVPSYDIIINTVVAQLNNVPNDTFDNIVGNLNYNQIRYSGRAIATVVQRTPYNISTNTALFVKHPMMWVPFAADPFVALSNNIQNIDKCIGLTQDYIIKGDLSTPGLSNNDFGRAFRFDPRNNSNKQALNYSGITGVWDGAADPNRDRLISGGSATAYSFIQLNTQGENNISSSGDFSIKNYNTKDLQNINNNNVDINQGKIPGTNNQGNLDIQKITEKIKDIDFNANIVTININSTSAILVGSDNNGGVTRAPANGGLIEMIWPTDNNNNFMPINDTSRNIVNSYPSKYATVYLVPEGNQLRIFAVGGYSKRKVNYKELLKNIPNLPGKVGQDQVDNNKAKAQNDEIIIDLNKLDKTERVSLAAIHVNGGNVVIMPNGSGKNGLYYIENNQPKPFDLTVIATRFNNTDDLNNRPFYDQNSQNEIGSWSIPNNFNPNNGQISLGNGGARYIIPSTSGPNWDNRRQVVRALEGNVIIQNFRDSDFDFKKGNNEVTGFIGYEWYNNPNDNRLSNFVRSTSNPNNPNLRIPLKPINIISQNYVILNYKNADDYFNNYGISNDNRKYLLSANIISYKGSLTIPDRDIYRWLMDGGRFKNVEYDDFKNSIVSEQKLLWYGRYLANFASVEGVVDPNDNNRIIGFSETEMIASDNGDLGIAIPRVNRTDWYVVVGSKRVILYDIVRFELNK